MRRQWGLVAAVLAVEALAEIELGAGLFRLAGIAIGVAELEVDAGIVRSDFRRGFELGPLRPRGFVCRLLVDEIELRQIARSEKRLRRFGRRRPRVDRLLRDMQFLLQCSILQKWTVIAVTQGGTSGLDAALHSVHSSRSTARCECETGITGGLWLPQR